MYTTRTKSAHAVADYGAVPFSSALNWRISEDELLRCDFNAAVAMYDAVHARREALCILHWMYGHCRLHRGYQLVACMRAFGTMLSRRELSFFYEIIEDAGDAENFYLWTLVQLPEYMLPMRACSMVGDDYDDVTDAFYNGWGG